LGKEQWVESTRGARLAWAYHSIILALEEAMEEEGLEPESLLVEERLLDTSVLEEAARAREARFRASVSHRYETEVNGMRVVVEPEESLWGVPASSLYEEAPREVIKSDSMLLKRLAHTTTMTGVEYIVLYHGGEAYVLEGEYLRVRIPFAKVAASVHTHPSGGCALSLADVSSALDLLAESGLFEAAATTTCAAVLYRVGPVDEDDYVAAREAILKASRGKREAFPRLKTIRYMVTGY